MFTVWAETSLATQWSVMKMFPDLSTAAALGLSSAATIVKKDCTRFGQHQQTQTATSE
jgi:hypothetical protein